MSNKNRWKKGAVSLLAIAVIALLSSFAIGGIIGHGLVTQTKYFKRIAAESEILESINWITSIKNALRDALEYAFYQSSFAVGNRGGYYDLSAVHSYRCVPYWREYDDTNYPTEYTANLESALLDVLNEYASELTYEIATLSYNSVDVEFENGMATIEATTEKIELRGDTAYGSYTIDDAANLKADIETKFSRLFEIGKENFVDDDKIGKAIAGAVDGFVCDSAQDDVRSAVEDAISDLESSFDYSNEDISVSLQIANVVFNPDCNSEVAVGVLVKITDETNQYRVYDSVAEESGMRNIALKFYVLSGNYEIDTPVAEC